MNWTLFIVLWLVGAVASWIGVLVYAMNGLSCMTRKEALSYIWSQRDSWIKELSKVALYLVAWPIEIGAVIYSAWYKNHTTKNFIENFPKLDEEES